MPRLLTEESVNKCEDLYGASVVQWLVMLSTYIVVTCIS